MVVTLSDRIVKSVKRVFEILELFDRERRSLKVAYIARELGYPHTSAVAYCAVWSRWGIVVFERGARAYSTSVAVSRVGEWVIASVHNETAIMDVMSDLHEKN